MTNESSLCNAGSVALSFKVYRHATGQVILQLWGELDQHSATTFHHALALALETVPTELLLDLSKVTAIEVGGVSVLFAARRAADQVHCRFRLSAVSQAVDGLLRAQGLTGEFIGLGYA
ncbi:STAS domain-containing protein [Dactylosporangium sp. NPDC005572]|uniref:STAS domain-containing protein n=1 Tax=Dactylosporangium sp. NPDC005572 TaxID=3156889 RepID=UPI0033A09787